MTSINTNAMATIASNALSKNDKAMSTAMERLSTGLRINSAKDDAAGLAIVKKMNAQVTGLNMAIKNANDGISMLQTFEGASVEVTNILDRMRELKVQSLNGTYTAEDRANLGAEFDQLRTEINRILSNTEWNTMSLMDQGPTTVNLQIGANANQTMGVTIANWAAGSASRTSPTVQTTLGVLGATNEVQTISVKQQSDGTTAVSAATDVVLAKGETFNIQYNDGQNTYTYSYTNNTASGVTWGGLKTQIEADVAAGGFLGGKFGTVTVHATNGTIALTSNELKDINLLSSTTTSGAAVPSAWSNVTLDEIDKSIEFATTERANYGAYINRLNYAADNLASVSTAINASRGRIEDADYAAETTELARTQIIAQAGTAMLAQANQVKQSVLALLK
jgi:flagellin